MSDLKRPPTAAIEKALSEICETMSSQQADLFAYIVNRYLELTGQPKEIIAKALSVKTLADDFLKLDRGHIRILALQVRARVEAYYESHPQQQVWIEIPKTHKGAGREGYVPEIRWRYSQLSEKAVLKSREARFARNQRTPTSFDKAVRFLGEILEDHPNHPDTLARLAEVYALRVMHAIDSPEDGLGRAHQCARLALERADYMWAAHIAMAAIHLCSCDWKEAESSFARALKLDQQETLLQSWYFFFLVARGKLPYLLQHLVEAANRDSVSQATVRRNLALALILDGNLDAAELELEQLIRDGKSHFLHHIYLAMSYHANGKFSEALAHSRAASDIPDGTFMAPGMLVLTLAHTDRAAAEKELALLLERKSAGEPYLAPMNLVVAHVGMGRLEEAMDWLEAAYESRDPLMLLLRQWPMMRPLHGHPRFKKLVERMNFP